MILEVSRVKYIRDYVLWIRFNDGTEGDVDLAGELDGPVFGPLRDKRLFSEVRVDSLLRTVVWPNGADLAPEFLRDLLGADSSKRISGLRATRLVKASQPAMVREKSGGYGAGKPANRKR
jgi:hypothetical protein